MSTHPVNLGLRFVLELCALLALGYSGAEQGTGFTSIALALGMPVIAAVIWGTFAVPDDPSRSGKAPVPVPGIVRLLLELMLFAGATAGLIDLEATTLAIVFAAVFILHYIVSYDRIIWLLKQ